MPFQSLGVYDVASQTTLLAVKARTDLLPDAPAAQGKLDSSLYTSRLTPTWGRVLDNTTVSIQPPAGETWVIFLAGGGNIVAAARSLHIENWDGTNRNVVSAVFTGSDGYIAVQGWFRITNTKYARITWTVSSLTSGEIWYSYWGWKE